MIEPGTVLAGRYRVLRHIGSGATGSVHLAEDELLGRNVAIKRVHAATDSEEGRRILREARLGAGLQHESLVTVFEVLPDGEAMLLITEYVPGTTLAEVLRRGPLEPRRALEILRPLAEALDGVHAAGIVHRDLKPANVLLHERGGVKLADLGVATSDAATRITQTGSLVGTVAYMAPEQFEPGRVTAAADIHALGTVAFEVLSGRRPYPSANAFEVMSRVREEPPPDLREALPEAPEAAAAALRRAMARDPAARHVTARAFVDELEAAYRERSPAPPPPAPPARPAPPPPPEPPRRSPPSAPAAPPRPGRGRRAAALAAVAAVGAAAAVVVLTATGDDGPEGGSQASTSARTATARTGTTPARTSAQGAARAAGPTTPAGAVRAFYGRAARGDLDGAWAVAGPRMRATFGGSRERFAATLGTLRSIRFARLEEVSREGGRATVELTTIARHTTRTDRCSGTLEAVRTGGAWRVEPQGVSCAPA